jgi:LysM repeat protein
MTYILRPVGSLFRPAPAPAAPKPAPAPTPAPTAPAKPAAPSAVRFIEAARAFIGQPYAWGGGHGSPMTKPGPVDASGLVQQAARRAGIKLDGTAAMQQTQGKAVAMTELKPGDLVFKGTPATHVGIYAGNNQVIAAFKPGKPAGLTNVRYFDNARRVFDAPQGGTVSPAPAPAPATPATPAPAAPKGTYTVKAGDSLYRIAKTELQDGSRWQEIYAMNPHKLPNPNKLVPGMVLKMPPLEPTGGSASIPANPYFNDDDF